MSRTIESGVMPPEALMAGAVSPASMAGGAVPEAVAANDAREDPAIGATIRVAQSVLRFLFAVGPDVAEQFHVAQAGTIGRLLDVDPPDLDLRFEADGPQAGHIVLEVDRLPAPKAEGEITRHLLRILGPLGAAAPRSLNHGALVAADAQARRQAALPATQLAREGLAILLDPHAPEPKRDAELRRDAIEKFHAARSWAQAAHVALHIPGRFAATYECIAALVGELADVPAQEFRAKLQPLLMQQTRGTGALIGAIAGAMAQSGFAGSILRAAEACLTRGMRQTQEAFDACTIETFPRAIYSAQPVFIAAMILASVLPDEDEVARGRLQRAAEAYILRGLQTLHHAVADTPDRAAFRAYRGAIARASSYQDARRGALELTDLLMVYPAACRRILLGEGTLQKP